MSDDIDSMDGRSSESPPGDPAARVIARNLLRPDLLELPTGEALRERLTQWNQASRFPLPGPVERRLQQRVLDAFGDVVDSRREYYEARRRNEGEPSDANREACLACLETVEERLAQASLTLNRWHKYHRLPSEGFARDSMDELHGHFKIINQQIDTNREHFGGTPARRTEASAPTPSPPATLRERVSMGSLRSAVSRIFRHNDSATPPLPADALDNVRRGQTAEADRQARATSRTGADTDSPSRHSSASDRDSVHRNSMEFDWSDRESGTVSPLEFASSPDKGKGKAKEQSPAPSATARDDGLSTHNDELYDYQLRDAIELSRNARDRVGNEAGPSAGPSGQSREAGPSGVQPHIGDSFAPDRERTDRPRSLREVLRKPPEYTTANAPPLPEGHQSIIASAKAQAEAEERIRHERQQGSSASAIPSAAADSGPSLPQRRAQGPASSISGSEPTIPPGLEGYAARVRSERARETIPADQPAPSPAAPSNSSQPSEQRRPLGPRAQPPAQAQQRAGVDHSPRPTTPSSPSHPRSPSRHRM